MENEEDGLLASVGAADRKMTKIDRKMWLGYARLRSGNPLVIRSETNLRLLADGRLEYSEAALAREAPASRNTIAANRERYAGILSGLEELEAARTAALREVEAAEQAERRSAAEKDRIIEEQSSVIAAQYAEIHGLRRRLASVSRRSVKPDDPSPSLGHRRQPAPATAPRGRGANPAAR